MEKINIGCGDDIRIGWNNTDKDEDWNKMKRNSNSVDAILMNHTAMYIRPEEMKPLVSKFHSWLKVGGTVHFETQDLDKVRDPETLYGMGKHAGHKWAWTPKTLGDILIEAGFEVSVMPGILHGKPERDFLISGIKLYNNENNKKQQRVRDRRSRFFRIALG